MKSLLSQLRKGFPYKKCSIVGDIYRGDFNAFTIDAHVSFLSKLSKGKIFGQYSIGLMPPKCSSTRNIISEQNVRVLKKSIAIRRSTIPQSFPPLPLSARGTIFEKTLPGGMSNFPLPGVVMIRTWERVLGSHV